MIKRTMLMFVCLSMICSAETGVASYYTIKSNRGTTTASGHKLKDTEMTAAHRTLPFGTVAKITNLKTQKSVEVTITDRGPYIKGRIIDGTKAVAEKLGFHKSGVAKVKVEVVKVSKKGKSK